MAGQGKFLTAAVTCSVLAGSALAQAQQAQELLPMAELSAGFHRIVAEVANTAPSRQMGLMFRRTMPTQQGMVFVFERAQIHCMWMKNTLLPLSVAFIDDDGKILNIADMKPHSEQSHCAAAPARFALEMNQGWFAERGIGAGDQLGGIAQLPPAR